MVSQSEALWTAASKLESQVCRNPDLPPVYREHVRDAFEALRSVHATLRQIGAPLRVSGQTEDGRMWVLSNADGFAVAHVYTRETADALAALSRFNVG